MKVNVKNSHYLELYSIIRKIYKSLPGLYGYVGVDIIMTPDKILVVEVNLDLPHLLLVSVALLALICLNQKKFMKLSNINPRSENLFIMTKEIYIGWDIGGAHLKSCVINGQKIVCSVDLCELWKTKETGYMIDRIIKKYTQQGVVYNLITMSRDVIFSIIENKV